MKYWFYKASIVPSQHDVSAPLDVYGRFSGVIETDSSVNASQAYAAMVQRVADKANDAGMKFPVPVVVMTDAFNLVDEDYDDIEGSAPVPDEDDEGEEEPIRKGLDS